MKVTVRVKTKVAVTMLAFVVMLTHGRVRLKQDDWFDDPDLNIDTDDTPSDTQGGNQTASYTTLPSESEAAQIVLAVFDGIGFFEDTEVVVNGTECQNGLIDSINQVYYIMRNVSEVGQEPFLKMDPYLNISAFISDGLSRVTLHCP